MGYFDEQRAQEDSDRADAQAVLAVCFIAVALLLGLVLAVSPGGGM